MKRYRCKFIKAWPPTVFITVLFFIHYYFFGIENTIIGPFVTLSFLRFHNMKRYYGCMLKTFGIYTVMALLAYIALSSIAACILVNAAALFWIGYILIDEYAPDNYFPSGMALIFFQISPANGERIYWRIGALLVSFLILFIFLKFIGTKNPDSIKSIITEGRTCCESLSDSLTTNDTLKISNLVNQLQDLTYRLSYQLYQQNRSSIASFSQHAEDLVLFQTTASLAKQYCTAQDPALKQQYTKDIETCRKALIKTKGKTGKKFKIRQNKLDFRSFRLRFALRLVIMITPCITIAYVSNWANSYWLAISLFFMMIPIYENTFKRIGQRIKGTLIGLLLCIVLFLFFEGFWERVVIMTLANFFIYLSESYTAVVIGITCSALALNFTIDNYLLILIQRAIYTFAGAALALTANRFVFRTRAEKQLLYMDELLHATAADLTSDSLSAPAEAIIKSQLIIRQMYNFTTLARNLPAGFNLGRIADTHLDHLTENILQQISAD